MTWALLLTSFGFGLRHGVDWDHIAAIADLSSNAADRRRGFFLSMLYSVGHGVVVFGLGVIIILVGATLPDSVDAWMGRVVGATLVFLGLTILYGLVRNGRDFRLQSRWMLIINGTFGGIRKVRNATSRRSIAVEHDHDHAHDSPDQGLDHEQAHDHSHVVEVTGDRARTIVPDRTDALVGAGTKDRRRWPGLHRHNGGSGHSHSHRHRHELGLPEDPTARYSSGTATGIGMIHGVGIESPTQIAVFVSATAAAGTGQGLMLLAVWVLGLIVANAGLALVTGFGLLSVERNFRLYASVAVFMALLSIGLGCLYIAGVELA